MEQIKIGKFLKTLRLEKGLTQEQLAERLQVSARTVSRWETGSNLPDISVLVELAEFYGVGIPEIIYAEREREIMTEETKKTAQTLGEYAEMINKRLRRRICLLTALGLVCFTIYLVLKAVGVSEAGRAGSFFSGAALGFSYVSMILDLLYASGLLGRIRASSELKKKKD